MRKGGWAHLNGRTRKKEEKSDKRAPPDTTIRATWVLFMVVHDGWDCKKRGKRENLPVQVYYTISSRRKKKKKKNKQ